MLKELKSLLEGKIVGGRYETVVGKFNPREEVIYRPGVDKDEFKGRISTVFRSKEGNFCVTLRNFNRITPGDRMAVSDSRLKLAEADPRAYKGLPGEFKYRTLRLEGIQSLAVLKAGKWVPLALSCQEWDEKLKAHFAAHPPPEPVKVPRRKRVKFSDWAELVEAARVLIPAHLALKKDKVFSERLRA